MSARADRQHAALPLLYGDLRHWGLIAADSLTLLAAFPDASVDAIVTDPPYGLNFNQQAWDGGALASGEGFQAFTAAWARELRRILKPGAYLAAFGASRTAHRLIAGIEDGGLDVRDQLLWLYGSGVPKSRRLPGGLGSALKPAYEPIVLARRPLDLSIPSTLANVARHGTGGLNIDAARVEWPSTQPTGEGFWPPNLALSHEAGCRAAACRPACVTRLIDEIAAREREPSAPPFARLFYAAKARRAEREAGCEQLEARVSPIFAHGEGTPKARANAHPTVKPIGLMRWIVRLVVPPGGVVLDPFAGSGSTGIAAVLEERQFVGIEREAEYVRIARARLRHWTAVALAERRGAA
jgi:site-specific DNA-methyltransferase (adenine-specific)